MSTIHSPSIVEELINKIKVLNDSLSEAKQRIKELEYKLYIEPRYDVYEEIN